MVNGILSVPFGNGLTNKDGHKYVKCFSGKDCNYWKQKNKKCIVAINYINNEKNELLDDLNDLFGKLFEKLPEKRITIESIKGHPWYEKEKSFNKENFYFYRNTMSNLVFKVNQQNPNTFKYTTIVAPSKWKNRPYQHLVIVDCM